MQQYRFWMNGELVKRVTMKSVKRAAVSTMMIPYEVVKSVSV